MMQNTEEILGTEALFASGEMHRLLGRVRRIAQTDASVLIEGESGSGKEIIARCVHAYSRRTAKNWVDVSCAALPENLIESELFGYERGAFSGANSGKPGFFELAHHGTLFLDEIGDLPAPLQVKLLRVLDGAPYYRLGGTRKILVDVRIVAATNRDLKSLVKEGRFREDLYFRLSQTSVYVPPLRERVDDLEPLALFFLGKIRPGVTLSSGALRKMGEYSWPGNIRELRNVMTRAAIFCEGDDVQASDIDVNAANSHASRRDEGETAVRQLEDVERQTILSTLHEVAGHKQRAADRLGISSRTLSRRLRDYGMQSLRIA